MVYNESANLTVRAYTGTALPVEEVTVRIRGADEENFEVEYTLFTDMDGFAGPVSLPTPPKPLSLSAGAPEAPYSKYDVEIIKRGYYTKELLGLAMFSGVPAILPIDMIPLSAGVDSGRIELTLMQNERLE